MTLHFRPGEPLNHIHQDTKSARLVVVSNLSRTVHNHQQSRRVIIGQCSVQGLQANAMDIRTIDEAPAMADGTGWKISRELKKKRKKILTKCSALKFYALD